MEKCPGYLGIVESTGRVYKTLIRRAVMYGAKTWLVKKVEGKKLDAGEIKVLQRG